MTGYTVHTGPSGKFSEGWQRIFGASAKKSKAKPAEKPAKAAQPKAKSSKSRKSAR